MPTPSLPAELWDEIFELATHIPGEYDIEPLNWWEPDYHFERAKAYESNYISYALTWREMRGTRRSIVLVCRSWNAVATRYLYGSYYHYASAYEEWPSRNFLTFAFVCKQNPLLAGYVRRISLDARPDLKFFPAEVNDVFTSCHNVKKLGLHPIFCKSTTNYPTNLQSLTVDSPSKYTDNDLVWLNEGLMDSKDLRHIEISSPATRRIFYLLAVPRTESESLVSTLVSLRPPFSITAYHYRWHIQYNLAQTTHLYIAFDVMDSNRNSIDAPNLVNLDYVDFFLLDNNESSLLDFHDIFPSLDHLSSLKLTFSNFEDDLPRIPEYTNSPLQRSKLPKLEKIFLVNNGTTTAAHISWLVDWMKDEALDVEWYASDIDDSASCWIEKGEWIALMSKKFGL